MKISDGRTAVGLLLLLLLLLLLGCCLVLRQLWT